VTNEYSKSFGEFVERHVCLHSGADETLKKSLRDNLRHMVWYAVKEGIELYEEWKAKHEETPELAKIKACAEVCEGLDVDLPEKP